MYVSPITSSAAAAPLTGAGRYDRPLVAFIHNHLSPADWPRGTELARMAWAQALGSLQVAPTAGMEDGIPAWLAAAARRVIREQTSPAVFAAGRLSVTAAETVAETSSGPHDSSLADTSPTTNDRQPLAA
ncbi:hypothetical protein ACH4FE_35805 [Streptomyces celluloflavus]|uniref:hypothetical protein n=1 Tax=Streptomyces celluloflavus TaxID=58344 RepID=UPI00378D4003